MSSSGDATQSRWVIHIDMDAFFASCEQLTRPTLRGRPVLVGGVMGRGVVAGCSYEARAFGAKSAMPMHRARHLVGPAAVSLPPRMEVYRAASRQVMEVLAGAAPIVEQLSVDEAFLEPEELRGASVDQCRKYAQWLREQVREATGLPASVGAGSGKQYAKIASDLGKPDGVYVIARHDHRRLLDPLPAGKLWGIGPVTRHKLTQAGVLTIGDVAALGDVDAAQLLGRAHGRSVVAIAQGRDDRPVAEPAESKQISAESTFANDLTTAKEVADAIGRSAAKVHRRLIDDGRWSKTVTVKLRRSDFTSVTRSITLRDATTSLEEIVNAAATVAPDPVSFGSVRLVGVSISGLVVPTQEPLFVSQRDILVKQQSTVAETVGPDDADDDADDGDGELAPAPHGSTLGDDRSSEPGPERVQDWPPGLDVNHPDHGHGWVQGSGHGRVSIRFETRHTGPGPMRTFAVDDPLLNPADPLDSFGW